MDAYTKMVRAEMRETLLVAQESHRLAMVALDAAQEKHGIWMCDRAAHPEVLRAFAREEAAGLAVLGVQHIIEQWDALAGLSATTRTVALMEGPEVAF
jgi:hypothetical protein